ncbi:MAG: sugar phosphate isomerase/epimerase family protein [Acidobacteriota bacterium]|nr:sugar phosphate isomerase/epimerase family protein [Acidobacteriota bacterium]
MKPCFSTLGCPGWSVERVLQAIGEWGYEGIELRGLENEMHLPDSPHLAPGSTFLTRLAESGCDLVVLGSSASFARTDAAEKECEAYVRLAAATGAPIVRVFGGGLPEDASRQHAVELLAPSLRRMCDLAGAMGVTIGLETHDAWCRGDECALILDAVDHPALGIVWDAHHSIRHGETPDQTLRAVGDRIIHVHLKDGFWQDGKARYTLFGEGDLPLRQVLQCLKNAGYKGYLSLEWEKKWHPELQGPEVAFPQYASKLKEMLADLK